MPEDRATLLRYETAPISKTVFLLSPLGLLLRFFVAPALVDPVCVLTCCVGRNERRVRYENHGSAGKGARPAGRLAMRTVRALALTSRRAECSENHRSGDPAGAQLQARGRKDSEDRTAMPEKDTAQQAAQDGFGKEYYACTVCALRTAGLLRARASDWYAVLY